MASSKFGRRNSRAAKLTISQVQDIRALYARGDCTQGELSRDFQVSIVQIGRIVRGEVWQSLPALPPTSRQLAESAKKLLELQQETRAEASGGMDKLREMSAELLKSDQMLEEIKQGPPTVDERAKAYGFTLRKPGEKDE